MAIITSEYKNLKHYDSPRLVKSINTKVLRKMQMHLSTELFSIDALEERLALLM